MVFNRKGKFFLNLDEKAAAKPVTVAPVAAPVPAEKPAKAAQPAAPTLAVPAAAAAAAPQAEAEAASTAPALTTAEAIAAELAAAQAARPAMQTVTFAPECVTAGGALPMRRRRGGANLAGFKTMAGSLFGKK
jgi:hypothetical protein